MEDINVFILSLFLYHSFLFSYTAHLFEMGKIYSVVSTEEAKYLVKKVHEIDPKAFVNIIKTDYINGRFYQKTDY